MLGMKQKKKSTATHLGLEEGLRMFGQHNRNAHRLFIIFTDGQSDQPQILMETANKVRNKVRNPFN